MKDKNKAKKQLINELGEMRQKTTETEISKLYKAVFDNAADGILIAGIENMKFYMGNKMICEMSGYSQEEIKNMGVMDIHREEDLPYVTEQFKRLSRKEIVLAKDIPVRRKDGSIFYADIKSFFITITGEPHITAIFRDITERKRMEEALQNSEKSARTLLNIPLAAAFLLDRNGICLEANETLAKRLGKKVSDIVGKSIWEFFPSDVSAKRKAHFEGVLAIKQQCRYEDERQGMWNDSVISPILDEQGKVTKVAVFGLDITERKLTEEALRTSENKYRMLVEHSLQGILIACDSPLSFVFVNQALGDIFGYTTDELMSLSPKEINNLLHPEDYPIFSQRFRDRLKGKQVPPRYEGRIIRKDGTVRWVEVYNSRIDYEGKPAVQTAFIDITDRKQAEEKLRISEERFRALTENTSDWIWEVDQSLVFTYTSPKIKDLLGYEPHEVIGKTPFDFMPEHEARRISEISHSILSPHKPFMLLENINLRKDGQQVIIETSGIPIFDKDGNFSGYRGIDRDITERKKTEEILKEKERELEIKAANLETEIAERKRAEISLREINATLEQRVAERTAVLEEINAALNVLLKKREDDKTEIEERVLLNIRQVVEPYLEKLRLSGLDKRQKALADILESNLKEIISSFAYSLSSMHLNMTPKELKIANLIRQGRTSKEICEILGSSEKVVAFHRQNIRRKLGLLNKKVNLTSYLRQKFQ